MACAPTATVAIPTRARPGYLDVALTSIAPQAAAAHAEVIVVADGADALTAAVAARHGARLVAIPEPATLNASRNAAVAAAGSELIVFVDDDVRAPAGWLDALLAGAAASPEVDVFGGPIRPVLEGGGPRACGREPAPITALDLGPADQDVAVVWGANMAIRAGAFERIGPFDETLAGRGDEEEWLLRYADAGGESGTRGRVRYLAQAGLEHRRSPEDSRLRPLASAAYHLGRTARRNDVRKRVAPPASRELRDLAGALWHAVRRRCGFGLVFAAHAVGRLHETLRPASPGSQGRPASPMADDFLSGASGHVAGIRATSSARVADAIADLSRLPTRRAVQRAASRAPSRRVLVLALERGAARGLVDEAATELSRSHHRVELVRAQAGERGKFENLAVLLEGRAVEGIDWLIVLDDDVALPRGFLDMFIFLAERFDLAIAQPAHRRYSHAAWAVTRRHRGSVVRETAFVEIGPVVGFHARTFATLLPFPPLRTGWGLDAHWSALAAERGWRIGVIDATAVEHALRPVGASYDANAALEEARAFLADRPYVRSGEAGRTLVTHRRW